MLGQGWRRVVLAGGSVVLADRVVTADVTIEDGLVVAIAAIGEAVRPTDASHATVVDCAGCDILPGFVDLHTDNIERHVEVRPGIFWPPERAVLAHDAELASAGVTTAFDAITLGGGFADRARQDSAIATIAALERAHAEQLLRVDHQLHLRCELSDASLPAILDNLDSLHGLAGLDSLDGLGTAGFVRARIVSLMNHTPGQRQWRDLGKFRTHYVQRYGLSDAGLTALIAARQHSEREALPANHQRSIAFAARTAARLASHDDTEPNDVDEAAAAGCVLSEFPTTALAAAHAAARGLAVIAGAPNLVRGASHSGNVSASELARAGHLHVLSSDYSPASLLQAVYLLHDREGWPLADAARTVSLTPARIMGLDDRGEIAIGRRADVIVVSHTGLGPVIRETWAHGRRVF
jgi:alpha-D-ribose 1-methylphosphonate 5-triphosphate diphosphatase